MKGGVMHRMVLALGVVLLIGGCGSTGPQPMFLHGQYYMAGDSRCVQYRPLSPISIMCGDTQGSETEARYSLTPQQVQQWNLRQAEARATISEIADELLVCPNGVIRFRC